ncbi:MAG: class F sortase [Chloroflexi bacterium]|nr:class F sortase [Chloroflexota bacterium]
MTYTRARRGVFVSLALGALAGSMALSACGRSEDAPPPPAPTVTVAAAATAVPTRPAAPTAQLTAQPTLPPIVRAAPTAVPTLLPEVPAAFVSPTEVPKPSVPVAEPGPAFREAQRPAAALPLSISIPRFHSEANVVTLGMDDDGTMEVPSDPDTIGWYDFTAKVGAPGNAVLVGHVDWAGRLRAFGHLRDLREGDRIDVVDQLDRQLTYDVESVETIDATTEPTEYLTQHGPDEELTLITCGGAFDRASHQYLSRVIVRALRDAS